MNPSLQSPTHKGRLAEAAAYSRFSFEATKREEQLKRDGYSELTAQKIARMEFKEKVDGYRKAMLASEEGGGESGLAKGGE